MNKFLNLIKRGGGTGPVKPGNQRKICEMVPIPARYILGR